MSKRSLQASPLGVKQAKKAFNNKGWTQENLAGFVNLKTRQPVWRFFTGRPIERYTFIEICSVLELSWWEIAVNPPAEIFDLGQVSTVSINIDALVKKVRSQCREKIQHQCGTLQLLDTNRPVEIQNIYTDVNILPEIASQQWLDISKQQNHPAAEFDTGFADVEKIPSIKAVETYSKLRVLGKPGCGKTTFLQHLAIQCNQGNFAANLVPIFITWRYFADDSKDAGTFGLLNYISSELFSSELEHSTIETLLREGRVLLLIDGLDEVPQSENKAILKEIRRFSEKYPQNLFVVTCRTAAQAFNLKGFTDVEIAPLTQSQIVTFAQKWFSVFTNSSGLSKINMAGEFVKKLDLPENLPFRRLVVTPLFLHLACWVFHRQQKFPNKKAEFYKQCLELLLGKWDQIRGIERDEIYPSFLLPQKLKLISQIAAATFENGNYLFKQRVVEQYIGDFMINLPNAPTEPEELQLDSEVVLKAIELQHGLLVERVRGIFSFSCLTFQEYFTARKIVASDSLQSSSVLESLVSHITESRWREVFLLTTAMLRNPDFFVQLMKRKIDALVAEDVYLQEFLTWTSQMGIPQQTLVPTRTFYFGLTQIPDVAFGFALACTLDQGILLDVLLDNLVSEYTIESSDFTDLLNNALAIVLDVGLQQSLQQLKEELPDSGIDPTTFQSWWQVNYLSWTERLKTAIYFYRNIQSCWHFSPEQQKVLQNYYDASNLLIDCLNSNCEITVAVRQEIESTLLLPQKQLGERKWDKNYPNHWLFSPVKVQVYDAVDKLKDFSQKTSTTKTK